MEQRQWVPIAEHEHLWQCWILALERIDVLEDRVRHLGSQRLAQVLGKDLNVDQPGS